MMTVDKNTFETEQLITYIGNKRKLLPEIEKQVIRVQNELQKEKLNCIDLFSGSGVVSRMLMSYADYLYAVDLEGYSKCINDCYLYTDKSLSPDILYHLWRKLRDRIRHAYGMSGFFTENYSESRDGVQPTDRLFYTWENGVFLDTFKYWLKEFVKDCGEEYDEWLYNFFMAPILSEASIHVNTCGVFKGFYKGKDGKGKFGGENENCLERIKGGIDFMYPVISGHWKSVKSRACQMDCNDFAHWSFYMAIKKDDINKFDFTYIDPPYNQHPYGSNYFMLNLLADKDEKYKELSKDDFSKVSGIPKDWNRSDYNVKTKAKEKLFMLLKDVYSKYVLLSYSSDGFIPYDDMVKYLNDNGDIVDIINIDYQSFRGSRNFDKEKKVTERMFLWRKGDNPII